VNHQFELSPSPPSSVFPSKDDHPVLKSFSAVHFDSSGKSSTRNITISLTFPNYIWSVMSFEAHIHSWSIPAPLTRLGTNQYVIRHAGGYGCTEWSFWMVIDDHDHQSQPLQVTVHALERDAYHSLLDLSAISSDLSSDSPSDSSSIISKSLGKGRPWRWSNNWESGRELARVEGGMPNWVTSFYGGVVTKNWEV